MFNIKYPPVDTTAFGILGATLVAATLSGFTERARAEFPVYQDPKINQTAMLTTNPFAGTSSRPSGSEGLAYVPKDGSLWLADDDLHQLYEIDVDTGALKRTITQATLAKVPLFGGRGEAGNDRAADFKALAYDERNDVLYAFTGECCLENIRAAAFRFTRSSDGRLVPDSHQRFDRGHDFSGIGAAAGNVYLAQGKTIYSYDYENGTHSSQFSVPIEGDFDINGVGISDDGIDLWLTTSNKRLIRLNLGSRTFVPRYNWNTEDLNVNDPRGVEVIDDQLYLVDGFDDYKPSTNPARYAIRRFKIVDGSTQTYSR